MEAAAAPYYVAPNSRLTGDVDYLIEVLLACRRRDLFGPPTGLVSRLRSRALTGRKGPRTGREGIPSSGHLETLSSRNETDREVRID